VPPLSSVRVRKPPAEDIPFIQEVWRKLTHTGALVIPGGYVILGLTKSEALYILVPISILMTLIDIGRLRGWKFWESFAEPVLGRMIRDHEQAGDFTGAFYILWSSCLTVALYEKSIAVAALTFIIVGDTFAALLGRKFGRHRFNGKSVEGSLGCLAGTVIVALAIHGLFPDLPLSVAIVGAVIATITEAVSFNMDDNVSVPLVSGLAMTLIITLIEPG
jgi:dolichol kinase